MAVSHPEVDPEPALVLSGYGGVPGRPAIAAIRWCDQDLAL
jgi:hypothetical protein